MQYPWSFKLATESLFTCTISYSNFEVCGLYYKIIMMIVSDDCNWTLYYKFFTAIVGALPLALATVVNYDHKW